MSCGVHIFEFRNYFLHAKNVSIDGQIGVLGSSNVDLRSFQLNEEVSLLLLDPNSVAALESVQRSYLANSMEVELERWRQRDRSVRFAENMARLISPVL